jgi:hypothetical protein
MAEAVGWAQMQVAQAVVAVKRRPEPVSAEPIPTTTVISARKTTPVGNKQLSLTALFQKHGAQGRRRRRRRAPEQQMALFDVPAPA